MENHEIAREIMKVIRIDDEIVLDLTIEDRFRTLLVGTKFENLENFIADEEDVWEILKECKRRIPWKKDADGFLYVC